MAELKTKKEFMERLRWRLAHLPEEQIADILYDYEEHFQIGAERGESEEEIVRKLGSPSAIAAHYRFEFVMDSMKLDGERCGKPVHLLRAMLAALGLGFFNVVFVLGFYLAALFSQLAFFLSGIAIVVSGLALILSGIFPFPPFVDMTILNIGNPIVSPFLISLGFGLAAGGLLLVIGVYALGKKTYYWTLRYLHANMEIIKKAGK